jgi:hypothetical protein
MNMYLSCRREEETTQRCGGRGTGGQIQSLSIHYGEIKQYLILSEQQRRLLSGTAHNNGRNGANTIAPNT